MAASYPVGLLNGPERYEEVSLELIDISLFNVRKDLTAGQEETDIDDLARSIAQDGLLQAPIARPRPDGRYEVIIGQRRILACRKLAKTPVRMRVIEVSDSAARILSLTENLQRATMSPIDMARTYEAIFEELGSVEAVSRAVKASPRVVESRLKLLKLTPSLQNQLSTGSGTEGITAYAALADNFAPEDQEDAWRATGGLIPSQAARVLKSSGGDFDRLMEQKRRVMEETLDVQFVEPCGSSAGTCPFIPVPLREQIMQLVKEFNANQRGQ
jgi:ParB/RepB/Spo0J family partition protein